MADVPDVSLSPSQVFGIILGLCRDYVVSDLQLLSDELKKIAKTDVYGVHSLLTSVGMSAVLKFDFVVSEERKISFRLKKSKRSEHVAELVVRLKLAPAPGKSSGDDRKVRMYGAWPRLVERADPNGRLLLRLAGEGPVDMRFSSDGDFRKAAMQVGSKNVKFEELPSELMATAMLLLADWARSDGGIELSAR